MPDYQEPCKNADTGCIREENPYESARQKGVDAIVISTMQTFDRSCENLFAAIREEARVRVSKLFSGR